MPSDVLPPGERPIILPKGDGLELTWAGMGWKVRVERFKDTGKDLYAEVTYYQGTDGSSTLIAGPLDLNLKSGRVGKEHVDLIIGRCWDLTDIQKAMVKATIDVLIGQIQSEAVRWHRAPPQPIWLHDVQVNEGKREYLIPKLIQKNVINTIVADGGGGKSYLALAIAASLSNGPGVYQIPLLRPLEQGTVLYMDFECDEEDHAVRLWQITRGLGMEARPDRIAHLRFTQPLRKLHGIHEIVEQIDPILIVTDSLGYALGGDITSQEPVSEAFQIIRSWDRTALVLHHMNREKEFFGTIYIRNSTRNLWLMESTLIRGGRHLHLKQDKVNSGRGGGRMDLDMRFTDDETRVNFYEMTYDEQESQKTSAEKIREHFAKVSEDTPTEVSRATGVRRTSVNDILGTTEYEKAPKRGKEVYYRLAAPVTQNNVTGNVTDMFS